MMKPLLVASLLLTASCHSMGAGNGEQESTPQVYMVVTLKYANAWEVAEIVNDLEGTCLQHVTRPEADRHGPPLHRGVYCAPDRRTNSVVVSGTKADIAQVLELISRLDMEVH